MNDVQVQQAESDFNQSLEILKSQIEEQKPLLTQMSIPMAKAGSLSTSTLPMSGDAEQITIKVEWWGINIIMNDKLTQDVVSGVTGSGAVGGLIAAALGAAGVVTGGVATVIGAAVAAIFALKVAQIKITNNGKGVHWPITWIQWAALLAAVPAGIPGIVAAGMLFLHPIRN